MKWKSRSPGKNLSRIGYGHMLLPFALLFAVIAVFVFDRKTLQTREASPA